MSEVEFVARRLCKLAGVDPDYRAAGTYPSVVNRDGARQMIDYVSDPNWKRFEITAQSAINAVREFADQVRG